MAAHNQRWWSSTNDSVPNVQQICWPNDDIVAAAVFNLKKNIIGSRKKHLQNKFCFNETKHSKKKGNLIFFVSKISLNIYIFSHFFFYFFSNIFFK